jgi:hypothetical protein
LVERESFANAYAPGIGIHQLRFASGKDTEARLDRNIIQVLLSISSGDPSFTPSRSFSLS